MSTEANKALVLRFLDGVWGKGDLDLIEELIAPDHVHHLTRRDMHGPAGVRQLVIWFRNFMPDASAIYHDVIAEGDRVVVYFTLQGTDTGGYMGRPPSNQPVSYAGIDIFRIRDGRIVERRGRGIGSKWTKTYVKHKNEARSY
jgi:steroid delta-isomerase-like uncharacterized protein